MVPREKDDIRVTESDEEILAYDVSDETLPNAQADHPAFIFQVVGQSRDDAPTVVQAGSCHPARSQTANTHSGRTLVT